LPAGSGSESESQQADNQERDTTPETTSFEDSGDWGSASSSGPRSDDDDNDFQDIQAAETSLRDHLNQQLSLSPMSDRDRSLCRFIVEAIDDDGYLNQSLEDLLELLQPELEIELDDLSVA
ncbi:hypothetical protein V6O07_09030, partial [Arthrospira platensis SPKY2]